MGYSLTIGQLKTTIENDGIETSIISHAERANFEDAPAYGEPTDFSNSRWPSYSSWGDAMRFVGLYDLMFNKETGLMRKHPGCFPLNAFHKEAIDRAHKYFYEQYPKARAGFSPKLKEDMFFEDHDWPIENNMAVRLEWLKYWVDWALVNCTNPVFYNS